MRTFKIPSMSRDEIALLWNIVHVRILKQDGVEALTGYPLPAAEEAATVESSLTEKGLLHTDRSGASRFTPLGGLMIFKIMQNTIQSSN